MGWGRVRFLLFSVLFIAVSCSTVAHVDSTESVSGVFSSVETVEPGWESLANGVDYFHGRVTSPRLEFWVVRVDLNVTGVNIVVNNNVGTVSGFVRGNNLIAGINASPFDRQRKNIGVIISDGVMHSSPAGQYDAIVFYRDGQNIRAAIVSQAEIFTDVKIENAVGGFHRILADGQPAQRTLHEGTVSVQRHPRSAAGVSLNGDVLYLLVIDGRRPGSVGATELETALLLRALGSSEGLNFDGGGSTALAIRYPTGTVKTVNTPSDLGIERTVTSRLGISNNEQ